MSDDFRNSQGSVVSMDATKAGRTHAAINQIESYWEALRQGRLVPNRQDIDPRGLTGVLDRAFIVERIAPGLGRFRVAGGHLTDLMGMEVRGMPLSAMFEPDARGDLNDALEAVFAEPATVRLQLRSPRGIGRATLRGELILLPLKSDLGDTTRALGGIVMEGSIGRNPRRMVIEAQSRRTLIGYGEPAQPVPENAPAAGVRPVSERHFLQLVVDNE